VAGLEGWLRDQRSRLSPTALPSVSKASLLQLLNTDTFALTARANSVLLLYRFAVTFNGQNGRDRIGSACR
jgi:hypothetical protein